MAKNNIVDNNTKKLLNKVTNQINSNNKKFTNSKNLKFNMNNVISQNITYPINNPIVTNAYPITVTNGVSQQITWGGAQDTQESATPSPNIDMTNPIYQNEFEESWIAEIGKRGILDMYGNYNTKHASIGLIDEVSENEEDLYAKFPDGEIIPFKGHQERISIEFETWNDLKRSELIGNEIKKAATCKIFINDRLARIIEGAEVQDLLMKADRAIDELKAQPFSICRDNNNLVGREIYYDNQPAIIVGIDEMDNFLIITPDIKYMNQFSPPVHAIEEDEAEEWITKFGHSMMVHDYDEKIWWWRNNKSGAGSDLTKDPFYGQFPQPTPITVPPMTYPQLPNTYQPNTYGPITITPSNPWTINPLDTYSQYTYTYPSTGTTTSIGQPITTSIKYYNQNSVWTITEDANGIITEAVNNIPINPPDYTTPRDLDAQINDAIDYAGDVDPTMPNDLGEEEEDWTMRSNHENK